MSRTAKQRTAVTAFGVVLTLSLVGACSAADDGGNGSGGNGGTPQSAAPAPAQSGGTGGTAGQSKPQDTAQGKAAAKGDGTYQVGTDIKPGTYRTTGNTSLGCYWETAKDSTGEMESINANDNVTGASYVTLTDADKVFKSTGCKDWSAVDDKAAGAAPKTEFAGNGGMFKVGADIAPGTYKSAGIAEGSVGCYWERAKDARHGLESIAANDNPTGPAVVTITAQDGYFKTTGCSDWKKSG
ncbi:hypothetical protein [Streptomyces sp. NPDC090022]|uniref:hypothetical protein n=1 Tax=Streptomyces sp. NPDC090022 TaxID=3365920 RepID=UPI003802A43A